MKQDMDEVCQRSHTNTKPFGEWRFKRGLELEIEYDRQWNHAFQEGSETKVDRARVSEENRLFTEISTVFPMIVIQ